MHVVDVDPKRYPCGKYRSKWLACLKEYSGNLDFNQDNYSSNNTSTLLNIKSRVDSIFEYRLGLEKVMEEAFHSILKRQLKITLYNMKKLMVEGKEKLPHIWQDHRLNLSKLISKERKQ